MKKVSTLVGVLIILAAAIIMFGGVFAYEYFGTKIQPVIPTEQNQAQNTTPTTHPSITIMSPVGGEQWQLGTTHLITWSAIGFHSQTRVWLSVYDYSQHPNGYPNVQYPVNFSPTAGNMSLPVYSGSYSWTIPLNFATSSKMKIEISSNPTNDSILNEDISQQSNYFSIVAPTTNQTIGWKTYTNAQYGFSFKYPQDENVNLVNHVPPHGTDLVLGNDDFIEKDGWVKSGGLIDVDDDEILDFSIFQKPLNNLEQYVSNSNIGLSVNSIQINGKDAYGFTYQSVDNQETTRIFVQNSMHVFMFTFGSKNVSAGEIVNTLQFTK